MWAGTFSLLGYVLAENLERAEALASRGIFIFGGTIALLIGAYLAIRYMRVRENRSKLARRLEGTRVGRPALAFGRKIEPQARFFWHRLTPGELGLEFTTAMAVLAVSLFVVIGYGTVVVGDPSATPGDATAFQIANEVRSGWLDDVAQVVTDVGSGYVTLAVALALAVFLAAKRMWPELIVTVIAVAISHLAVPVLKELVDRPRPADPLTSSGGDAWPSGHAANAIIYAWIGFLAAVRGNVRVVSGTVLIVIGLVVAAAIGLSRVYLRVHFLSDVNSGAALAVAAFAGCSAVALLVVHFRDNGERA